MPVHPQQVQRKRKRRSDPAYTLTRQSLYCADGAIHLKSYREVAQTNTAVVSSLPMISIPAVCACDDASNKTQRDLVGPIHPQYLRDISCFEEFKSIFTQVVRCHRIVYTKMGALHGNLSPNKIMFTRSDYGAHLGYLNDCDIAKCILTHEASSLPSSRHRAGEAIYMAVDLLREGPPPHLYRHDLESFMYTLIWCALHFNLNGSEVPGINEAMERWAYGTRESIQCAKISLFVSADRQDQIFRAITPAFRPLERGIGELIYMFDDGYSAKGDRDKRLRRLRRDNKSQTPDPWNEDTLNGHVTYEKFMAAICEDHVTELDD